MLFTLCETVTRCSHIHIVSPVFVLSPVLLPAFSFQVNSTVRTLTFQKNFVFINFNKSSLKTVKKAFYFMLKALLYTKCGGQASFTPFFKKSKLSISLDQQSEMV